MIFTPIQEMCHKGKVLLEYVSGEYCIGERDVFDVSAVFDKSPTTHSLMFVDLYPIIPLMFASRENTQ